MRILLAGGGSGGPVAPLLAVADEIKKNHPKTAYLLVGTKKGPERLLAEKAGIGFVSIPSGKWRRYFSLANFLTPFLVVAGFARSVGVLKKFKPDLVFGTGSFVQVPVAYAAWLLGIPVALHQQDVLPSLANKLCQPVAKKITVTFEKSLTDFPVGLGLFYHKRKGDKVLLTGNPFRKSLKSATKAEGLKHFRLKPDLPVLYVVGGGTGAIFFNHLLKQALPQLTKTVQVIHSTGKGKMTLKPAENYHPYEFITEAGLAYAASDIVLCRAGLSTITELSNLEKLAIIVPMPKSHQEINGLLLAKLRAAIVVPQAKLSPLALAGLVRKLLFEPDLQKELVKNIGKIMPKNSGEKIAKVILELIGK